MIYVKFPNYKVEPTGTFLYKTLRAEEQKISESELQLWFVLNRYQSEPFIKKSIEEGYVVIAEDYTGTGIAWGVAKGLDMDWMETVNEHLRKENLAIMLFGERDLRAKEKIHVHEQNDKLIEKSKKIHGLLAKKYGWKKIAIQPKVMDTAKMIFKVVDDFLRER